MGPQPAPLLARFDLFVWNEVLRDIGEVTLDFNWLQAMENSVDPHHSEWLHGHYMNYSGYADKRYAIIRRSRSLVRFTCSFSISRDL